MTAKLLQGKSRRVSDSAEFHYRTRSGGKDKAADASTRTTHYGAPQVPAKTSIISYLPLSGQRKHSAASSGKFDHSISTINSFNHQGQPHRLSLPSCVGVHSHHSRENSQQLRQHTNTTHRHLLQVSHMPTHPSLCILCDTVSVFFISLLFQRISSKLCLALYHLQGFGLTRNMLLTKCFYLNH